jgi:hypothetical protein
MTKTIASRSVTLVPGQKYRITLKGRFMTDESIPEIEVGVRALNWADHNLGAPAGSSLIVSDFYFRSSPNEEDIYPLHGGMFLKTI